MGLEEFEDLMRAQNGLCACCGKGSPQDVDHDHVTNTVRGLLCSGCNTGIGQLRDDPAIVQAAIDYLDRHRDKPGTVHEGAAPYILSVA